MNTIGSKRIARISSLVQYGLLETLLLTQHWNKPYYWEIYHRWRDGRHRL